MVVLEGGRFWRPKVGCGGGFCWVIIILWFAIGGCGMFALERVVGLRLGGEVKELLLLLVVDVRLVAELEFDVRAEEKDDDELGST